tara:strand:- start:1176 stop:1481 length:306 start_codon:yes stop_codon:yes gene_type:complete
MKKMFKRLIDLFRSKKEEKVTERPKPKAKPKAKSKAKSKAKPKAKSKAKPKAKPKKTKVNITSQMKKDFVKDREKGLSFKSIGEKYGIPTSTVTYHIKNNK